MDSMPEAKLDAGNTDAEKTAAAARKAADDARCSTLWQAKFDARAWRAFLEGLKATAW